MLTSGKWVIRIGKCICRSTGFDEGVATNAKWEMRKQCILRKVFNNFSFRIELSLSSMTLWKIVSDRIDSIFIGQWPHSVTGFGFKSKNNYFPNKSIDFNAIYTHWFKPDWYVLPQGLHQFRNSCIFYSTKCFTVLQFAFVGECDADLLKLISTLQSPFSIFRWYRLI